MKLYRCDECGKETAIPIVLTLWPTSNEGREKTTHACGPDDAIRLIAPILRAGEYGSINIHQIRSNDYDE